MTGNDTLDFLVLIFWLGITVLVIEFYKHLRKDIDDDDRDN